ncbi:glycosyltransferase family 4 protein [Aeromicrobium sp.]|uniref:glycosyltransferase family 4 protein n=1 Tax=Aeromicrobium sp. TaxID=1871063 RepID=UPI0028AE7AFA|nr:glycosyltransferase family 4 protein [Aeromicrobium sp.]
MSDKRREDGESPTPVLVVVPWLEGGGAQAVLEELIHRASPTPIRLVVLFGGCRDHEHVLEAADSYEEFDLPRTARGVLAAAWRIREEVRRSSRVFSLIRGSHVVLGMSCSRLLRDREFAASFHQLPSTDRAGLRGRVEDMFCRRAIQQADLVTTPAPRARDELVQFGFCSPEQARFDPNPLASTFSATAPPRPVSRERLKLVFVGRLAEQKGVDLLQTLLEQVDVPLDLDVYGTGELEHVVRALEAWDHPQVRVNYRGRSTDMVSVYDDADAVLLPSRWELNPMVVWEAWARGRPVVASSIDVHRDLAAQGPLWLFDDGSQLARVLRALTDVTCREAAFGEGISVTRDSTNETAVERFIRTGPSAVEGLS